jgi:hypothetical protein
MYIKKYGNQVFESSLVSIIKESNVIMLLLNKRYSNGSKAGMDQKLGQMTEYCSSI